jgi:hypothetical protein
MPDGLEELDASVKAAQEKFSEVFLVLDDLKAARLVILAGFLDLSSELISIKTMLGGLYTQLTGIDPALDDLLDPGAIKRNSKKATSVGRLVEVFEGKGGAQGRMNPLEKNSQKATSVGRRERPPYRTTG